MKNQIPKVAILMAAYNGRKWIEEQLHSIWSQENVLIDIYISVDLSKDNTYVFLKNIAKDNKNLNILSYGKRYGDAAKNFYRLIKDVDTSPYDYIAFSDQDDIWHSQKLIRGINEMKLSGSQGFSSDVMAFWPDGKEKLVKKSYPQKRFDFIFESAGPGCTYIFCSEPFQEFKSFVINNWNKVLKIDFHDWLAYSFFRIKNYKWIIDNKPLMLYRQHSHNQFGANLSFRAYFARLKLIKNGWYLSQIKNISDVLNLDSINMSFILKNLMQTRRKKFDAISMIIFSFYIRK